MTSLQSTRPRHSRTVRGLRIAVLGPRASSDAFSDPIQEIAARLVENGHTLTVFAPNDRTGRHAHPRTGSAAPPSASTGAFGTLSRTGLAASHLLISRRHDVAFLLDPSNAPLIPLIRSRGTAVAVHLADLGRTKPVAHLHPRRTRASARLAVREADALISGSQSMQDDYLDEFGVPTELIRAGATILERSRSDVVEHLGLIPGRFHLTRLDSSDRVDVVAEGFHRSSARLPLVVLGVSSVPERALADITALARRDPRIRLVGADARAERQLYAHALSALHGRPTGGSGSSLLRAMGAATAVVAWDDVVNREVAGVAGSYFSSPAGLARAVEEVERYDFRFRDLGDLMQERARRFFDWDVAAEHYETLALRMSHGFSTRGTGSLRSTAVMPTPEARHG